MKPSHCAETTQEAAQAREIEATQAGAVQAVERLPFAILPDELAALHRFYEATEDGQDYDVPVPMMKRLAVIGLVRRVTGNRYEFTDFGLSVRNGDFADAALAATRPNAAPGDGQGAAAITGYRWRYIDHKGMTQNHWSYTPDDPREWRSWESGTEPKWGVNAECIAMVDAAPGAATAAREQEAPAKIRMWHDRIKVEHPTSEPEYWPSSLKAQYMEAEILELRAALASPAASPTSQPNAAAQEQQAGETDGLPFGIIDPDYARYYTLIRTTAWQCGYAIGLHGSFTRDLDLIAVPWTPQALPSDLLLKQIEFRTDLTRQEPEGREKPHGRLCWSLLLPGFTDPRWIDLSVVPAVPAPSGVESVSYRPPAAPETFSAHDAKEDLPK